MDYNEFMNKKEELHIPITLFSNKISKEIYPILLDYAKFPFVSDIVVLPNAYVNNDGLLSGVKISTQHAIIPSTIGHDIGCGICAWNTKLKVEDFKEDTFSIIESQILKKIPRGNELQEINVGMSPNGSFEPIPKFRISDDFLYDLKNDCSDFFNIVDLLSWIKSCQTLGSGNHFIQLAKDEDDYVWVLVHTGSNAFGEYIYNKYIELTNHWSKKWNSNLVNPNLAFLPDDTKEFNCFIKTVEWLEFFGEKNRKSILYKIWDIIEEALNLRFPVHLDKEIIDNKHNFISKKHYNGEVQEWKVNNDIVVLNPTEYGIIYGYNEETPTYIIKQSRIYADSEYSSVFVKELPIFDKCVEITGYNYTPTLQHNEVFDVAYTLTPIITVKG